MCLLCRTFGLGAYLGGRTGVLLEGDVEAAICEGTVAQHETDEYCWPLPHGLKLGIRVRNSDGEVVLFIESAAEPDVDSAKACARMPGTFSVGEAAPRQLADEEEQGDGTRDRDHSGADAMEPPRRRFSWRHLVDVLFRHR